MADAPKIWAGPFRAQAEDLRRRLARGGDLAGSISETTLRRFDAIVDLHLAAAPIDTHFDAIDCHRMFGSDFLTAGHTIRPAGPGDRLTMAALRWALPKGRNRPLWGQVSHADLDGGGFGGLGLAAHANRHNLFDFVRDDPWLTVKACYAAFRNYAERAERQAPGTLAWCRTADDLLRARREGKRALFFAAEGGHVLGKPDWHHAVPPDEDVRLDRLRRLRREFGALYLILDHYCLTDIGKPGIAVNLWRVFRRSKDLSAFGERLVQEAMACGLLLDLSHSSEATISKTCCLARRAGRPVIASHAGLRSRTMSGRRFDWTSRARMLTDKSVHDIVATGGAIGVAINPGWFMPTKVRDGPLRQFIAHYEALAEQIATCPQVGSKTRAFDHLLFGTDFDGAIAAIPSDMRSGADLLLVTLAMQDAGWSAEQVEKVYAGNFIRIVAAAEPPASAVERA